MLELFCIVASIYTTNALFLYFTHRIEPVPKITPLRVDALSPDIAIYLEQNISQMEKLGFVVEGFFEINTHPNINTYFVSLAERHLGDKGVVIVIQSPNAENVCYTEFSTRFDNDQVIITNNVFRVGAYPSFSQRILVQCPWISDIAYLYQLHCYIIRKEVHDKSVIASPVMYPKGQVKEFIQEMVFYRAWKILEKRGLLRYAAEEKMYRYTMLGAYLVLFRATWPGNQILTYLSTQYARQWEHQMLRDQ
jgi:hypothetical protein